MSTPDDETVAGPLGRAVLVESARFRHVIGHLAGGVTVVTTAEGGERLGMTASSVTSLSLEPPTILCSLNRRSSTGQAIARTQMFAVNILEEGQADLAERFALTLSSAEKFSGVPLVADPSGQPLLAEALAHLVCQVREVIPGGTHLIFLAEVVKAETRPGRPLAYYRGAFGYFALDEDVTVRERLREVVVGGGLATGDPIDPVAIATTLEAPATALHHALRELVAEGLLRRDPELGYVVADRGAHEADVAAARAAIELGALAAAAGGNLQPAIDAVTRAEAAAAAGHPAAHELHLGVHAAFVALRSSAALAQAHHQLMPAGDGRTRDSGGELSELLALDRRALEAAMEGDLDGVAQAVASHLARAGR